MQQSSTTSDARLSPVVSLPSMRVQQDASPANALQDDATDRTYHDDNIFSSNASVKIKLCQTSNNHDIAAGDAAMSGSSDHRVTLNRDLVSDITDHGAAVNSDVSSHIVGVDKTDISHMTTLGTILPSEAHGAFSIHKVSVNEALTSDEPGVGEDARQADIHSAEAANSNTIAAMGNRNPEFYSPTRKLDFTKKLSNKGCSDPLPGDAEEKITVKKKQNPLKRLFARKKGKFDPTAGDVSQNVIPCTDQEIASKSNQKHASPSSKFNMRIGKKKSQEVLDLNSLSGSGSTLEIDLLQDNPAARNFHQPHSDINVNDVKSNVIVSDINIIQHGEESSKGKSKSRGKLTKDNIIVIKSTGKFLSHFGSASVESVSVTHEEQTTKETAQINVSVKDEEKTAKESAQGNVNRQDNTEHQQSDNNHQHESLNDDDDDDDGDDLAHLDDMLNHIYANFTPMGTVVALPLTSNDSVLVSDRDQRAGISALKGGIENSDDKEQTGEIDVGNIDDKWEISMENLNDKAEIDMRNIDDKVQTGEVDMKTIDDKGEISMENSNDNVEIDVGNIDDKVQEENIRLGHIDDIPHDTVICKENVDEIPQEAMIRMKNTDVTVLGRENSTQNKDTVVPEDEIRVEKCVDKVQGEEITVQITVENIYDKVKRREIIVENLVADIPAITCESEHLHPLDDDTLTKDNGESIAFSKEADFKQNHTNVKRNSCTKKALGSSAPDRFASHKLASPTGGNDPIDCTTFGDDSTGVNMTSSGATHNALTWDKLTLDVNTPDNVMTDDPIYDFVGDTAAEDDLPEDDIPADDTGNCSPTPSEASQCEVVITQDVKTNALTTSSVVPPDVASQSGITKDGDLHNTTNPAIETHDAIKPEDDVSSCSTNELPVSTQAVYCLTCVDSKQVNSDMDTHDVAKLETPIHHSSFHSPDTESLQRTEVESSRRRGLEGLSVNNMSTERVQEIKEEVCKVNTTYDSVGDGIVRHNHQISTTKSDTVQSANKQTRSDSGSNDLLPFRDALTTQNDDAKLSSRPAQTPHGQLHPAGRLQAASISHAVHKPPIKPKPLIAQSLLRTAEVSNTPAPAGSGRHPLKPDRAVEKLKVDCPTPDLEVQAGTIMSVECLEKHLEGGCSQYQDQKNMNGDYQGHVDGVSSCKLSEGVLQARSSDLQEHLTMAESKVSGNDCVKVNVSDDVKHEVSVNGHVSDDVSVRERGTADQDKPMRIPGTQGGDNFSEKSRDQTLESTSLASQQVQQPVESTSVASQQVQEPIESTSVASQQVQQPIEITSVASQQVQAPTRNLVHGAKPLCSTSPDPHLAEHHTGLLVDEVLDTTLSTRLLVLSSQICEITLPHTPDSQDDNAVDKRVDNNLQYSSNLGIDVERGAATVDNPSKTIYEDSLHTTQETCVEGHASSTYTRDDSTRETHIHDTDNSRDYEYALDNTTSDNSNDDLDHVMNVNVKAIVDETANNESAFEFPDKNGDTTVSTPGVKSGRNVRYRDTNRDNIYDEISEDVYVKDVSCLTSKRFQFPWKKKEKKLDKRKDTKDCDNIVGKDKPKLRPPNGKPGLIPKPPPKVSECSRSSSNVQIASNTSAKRRSGKGRRKFASFTLPAEETLYHEIDEDLWQRKDATEDFSSSSSTTSDDDLHYETINYIQTDADNERETAGLPQQAMVHTKLLLNSSDSLGYEIPAKFSLTAMERARDSGGPDTSRVKFPPDQDSSSLNPETNEANGETQRGHDADLYSGEDLPTIGHDSKGNSGQGEPSSFPTDVATCDPSDSQTVLSGDVCGGFPLLRQETVSGNAKHRSETSDVENVHTSQTDSRNEVSGYSTGNVPTKSTSGGEITENRDSECSQILEEITLGESLRIPRVPARDKCNIGECAPPQNQSTSVGGEDRSHDRIGSSDSSDKALEKTSLGDRITIETAHAEDGSRHGYDTSRLSENLKRDNLNSLKSGMGEKTGGFGYVKLSMDSKEPGHKSTDVRTTLNVDTDTPRSQKSTCDTDKQNTTTVGKKSEIQAGHNQGVNNRQMLAGYNQVVQSLAAYFGGNNDSKNCHTERDNAGSLESRFCKLNGNDFPAAVSLANKDVCTDVHPVFVDAVSTNLQTTSCRREHESELSGSSQIDSGVSPQERRANNTSQGTPKVLLPAARSPSDVAGCSRRRFFSLSHTLTSRAEKTATVRRSFDSSMCAESSSDDTGLEVVHRSSSLPIVFSSDAGKVAHHSLGGASLSVMSASQNIHNHLDCHLQKQRSMTESKELDLEKPKELLKLACSSQAATDKVAKSLSGNQQETTNRKYSKKIPPIPQRMNTAAIDAAASLTVTTPEDDTDDMPEYDLPPIRAKRISQSRILSWPGLSVSYTAEPVDDPPSVTPNQSLHLPGSNKAEYAAPWEGKDLDTLGPSLQLYNSQSSTETVQGDGSSHTAGCDQVTADRCLTSRPGQTLDDRFLFSLGSSSKTVIVGHDDTETTRMFGKKHRKVPNEDDGQDTSPRKTTFIKLMTSLFHRKKKKFNVGGDHQQGDERTSEASEDDPTTFDVISSPLELASERESLDAQIMTRHEKETDVSTSTENAPGSGHTGECSVATVTNARPLCRLLKINDDHTRTIEFVQPWLHYQGVSLTTDLQQPAREGVFVAPFVDNSSSKLLAGFLEVGDQVLEIDGVDVSHMLLEEVNDLIQSKQHLTITIFPASADDC